MSDDASADGSSPLDATYDLYETGLHQFYDATQLTFHKNIYGGLLFSFVGNFSLIVAGGCPGFETSNPGLVSLIQGATFPVGLIHRCGALYWLSDVARHDSFAARSETNAVRSKFGGLMGRESDRGVIRCRYVLIPD